jgi:Ca-activated chloride channel family protein
VSFAWPLALWALLLLPAAVAAYLWLLRRRKAAVAYASLALVRDALGPRAGLRRHLPPLLLLLAVAAALLAVARPRATVTLPSQVRTVVLAMDVSLSMKADDVQPSRIAAAQTAARAFVEHLPPFTRIGLVSFGGSAQLVQPPTARVSDLMAAIERFELQRATATGSGLVVALATLLPDQGVDVAAVTFGTSGPRDRRSALQPSAPQSRQPPPVRPGSYPHGVIVLLSDGRRTTGPDPIEVAKMAADRGVRVYTVGFGTVRGATIGVDGWTAFVQLDEETLKSVADITRGEYFHADSAAGLESVYRQLNTRLVMERRETEVGALFSAAAAALAVVSALASVAWSGRIG